MGMAVTAYKKKEGQTRQVATGLAFMMSTTGEEGITVASSVMGGLCMSFLGGYLWVTSLVQVE